MSLFTDTLSKEYQAMVFSLHDEIGETFKSVVDCSQRVKALKTVKGVVLAKEVFVDKEIRYFDPDTYREVEEIFPEDENRNITLLSKPEWIQLYLPI